MAHYQYGKWVDATLVGLGASKSYYDAEAPEAILAGFEGKIAGEMGKRIADMIVRLRNGGKNELRLRKNKSLFTNNT